MQTSKEGTAEEKILVVEDSLDFQLMVRAALERHYPLLAVGTLEDARKHVASQKFKLLILDVGLPDGDGFSFCAELREQAATRSLPVIFLTGRTELDDKLKGFSLGADDYIVKPFQALELRARVEAKLARERLKTLAEPRETIQIGALRLELPTLRVFRSDAGETAIELGLTPIEFKILYHLARNQGQVVGREQLLNAVWGGKTHVFERATDKHVSSLRHKLGPSAAYIETVSKVGYRFALPA